MPSLLENCKESISTRLFPLIIDAGTATERSTPAIPNSQDGIINGVMLRMPALSGWLMTASTIKSLSGPRSYSPGTGICSSPPEILYPIAVAALDAILSSVILEEFAHTIFEKVGFRGSVWLLTTIPEPDRISNVVPPVTLGTTPPSIKPVCILRASLVLIKELEIIISDKDPVETVTAPCP